MGASVARRAVSPVARSRRRRPTPVAGQPLLLGLAQQLGLTGHGECYAAAHLAELGRRLGYKAPLAIDTQ